MAHFLLTYDLAPDYLDRRAAYRADHLALAQAAVDRGELILGGALADPADRAVLLFAGADAGAAEAFARADPYVTNGLVTEWRVRCWATVVGAAASGSAAAVSQSVRLWEGSNVNPIAEHRGRETWPDTAPPLPASRARR